MSASGGDLIVVPLTPRSGQGHDRKAPAAQAERLVFVGEATFADASGSGGLAPLADASTYTDFGKAPHFGAEAGQRLTLAPARYATRDSALLKSRKTVTVAPTRLSV